MGAGRIKSLGGRVQHLRSYLEPLKEMLSQGWTPETGVLSKGKNQRILLEEAFSKMLGEKRPYFKNES